MRLNLRDAERFIIKYYLYHKIKVKVDYYDNSLNIVFLGNEKYKYKIIIWEKFSFWQITPLDKQKTVDLPTIKLLEYLNDNFDIPLIFKLWKNCQSLEDQTIFYIWVDGDIWNLSKLDLDLLSFSKVIYTNNSLWLTWLLNKLDLKNIEIKDVSDIFNINFNNVSDILVLYYGDDYIFWQESIKINIYLNKYFNKVYVNQYHSELINYYSISHANYGNFIYLWDYKNNREDEINEIITYFVLKTNKFIKLFWLWDLISKSTLILNFNDKEDLLNFLKNIEIPNNYYIEVMYPTDLGYVNYVDTKDSFNSESLKYYSKNYKKITLFLYHKIMDDFKWYMRYNKYWEEKIFYFLSSPLSNIFGFTNKTLDIIKNADHIFCETIDWVKKLLTWAWIDIENKNFYYWDDLKNDIDTKESSKIKIDKELNKIYLLWEDLKKLNNLLEDWKKIVYLTDWWAPCILDPWDIIKKYINLFYMDYNIVWIKWPNVISTVMLSCKFEYKFIFWAPFIYAIYPCIDTLKKDKFFSWEYFSDTLIIFYSFWKNILNDLKSFKELFDKNYWLQIIGDIWTEREYNKLFEVNTALLDEEVEYIYNKIDNTVYFIKLFN